MPEKLISDRFPVIEPEGLELDWLVAFTTLAQSQAQRREGLVCTEGLFDFKAGQGELLRRELECALAPLAVTWLTLEHGATVVDIGDPLQPPSPVADGALVSIPGTAAAFTTADCLPLVIACPRQRVAAAVHAGWRSLAGGIIQAAVMRMQTTQGVDPVDLRVWIGPAIAGEDYEVSLEVRSALMACPAITARCFTQTRPGHWLADLPAAAAAVLSSMGVSSCHIVHYPESTFASRWLHSARRDGAASGRMATVVGIR